MNLLHSCIKKKDRYYEQRRSEYFVSTLAKLGSGPLVIFAFSALVCSALLISCAAKAVIVSSPVQSWAVDTEIDVLVIRPFLRFERIQDEKNLEASYYKGDSIEASILAAARNTVKSKEFLLVDSLRQHEEEMIELCNQIYSMSPKLSKGLITDESKDFLKSLASSNGRLAVLVNFLLVKVGPGATWDAYTGYITSSMSSTSVQVALIHCETGKVLWKSQLFLRELPNVKSKKFFESLESLYQTLPNKKEVMK